MEHRQSFKNEYIEKEKLKKKKKKKELNELFVSINPFWKEYRLIIIKSS